MKSEENGVWRTVGGRRIFIKEGQDLSSAMKESGKFKQPKYDYSDFSKSKVKDTLFHGSTEDFEEFSTKKSIEGNGALWFSEQSDYAEEMASVRNGTRMYEVKINTQNPMEVELEPGKFSDPKIEKKYIKEAKEKGYDAVIFKSKTEKEWEKDTFYAVFSNEQVKILKKYKI